MKRVIESVCYNTRSKKPRLLEPVFFKRKFSRPPVAATQLHNYFLKDTLVDWLKLQNRRGTRNCPGYSEKTFTNFLAKKGIEFESAIVQYINNNCVPVTTVASRFSDAGCKETIRLMKEGVPILHSAPLQHKKTYGIADLLIRSDYISHLVDVNPLTEDEKRIPAPLLSTNYHYLVIDIKFSTLPLRADGRLLLNSNSYPAYKAQTWVYTQAVGAIQGYTPDYAFILGRRWKNRSKDEVNHNFTCFNKLGVIDFKGVDKIYVSETVKAVKWIQDVRENKHNWKINPPSRPELYPNMCVDSGIWNSEKERIAKELGEITSIWYCGVGHREVSIRNGVSSWHDPRCNTSTMGIRGVRAPVIDQIIKVNQQTEHKILPTVISSDMFGWREEVNEVFVDFETLVDVFSDFSNLPNQNGSSMIFMIGVGRKVAGKWTYQNFLATDTTPEEEFRIMNEFAKHLETLGNPKIFFWSAEARFWKTSETRLFDRLGSAEMRNQISDNWKIEGWSDLSNLFRDEPIVIKDCFKFGLKAVAGAMRSHGMITAKIESNCNSGLLATVNAWEVYNTHNDNVAETPVMKDISVYNEFDCEVLYQILEYLRKNHS